MTAQATVYNTRAVGKRLADRKSVRINSNERDGKDYRRGKRLMVGIGVSRVLLSRFQRVAKLYVDRFFGKIGRVFFVCGATDQCIYVTRPILPKSGL
jgi:hypothetical protein